MLLLSIMLLLFAPDLFVADASTEKTYQVELSREELRGYVDDIGLFARNMPGVVEVRPLGEDRYLYMTEKEVPLKGSMSVDFLIEKQVANDSMTIYRSSDVNDLNYMFCSVRLVPVGEDRTSITVRLRVRLSREQASDVHWLAPILGEGFIADRMTEDLEEMLQEFIERSNMELYEQVQRISATR